MHNTLPRLGVWAPRRTGELRNAYKSLVLKLEGKCREENQLHATECFIAFIICSTSFGHLYAHHHELATILVLLPHTACNALVAGGRLLGAELQAVRPG